MARPVIIDALRTPRGRGTRGKGALSQVHAQELLAQTLRGLVARTGFDPADVDDVVAGCTIQREDQVYCIARQGLMAAGWPVEVTGITLNQVCGSSLQAVEYGATAVSAGKSRLVVCGGVEALSRVQMFDPHGGGLDGQNELLRRRFYQVPQGISADLCATTEGFSRAELDAYSLESQRRAGRAQAEGRLARGVLPVVDAGSGAVVLAQDELPRPKLTLDQLSRLPAAFAEIGSAQAGGWVHPTQTSRSERDVAGAESWDEVALRRFSDVTAGIRHCHTVGSSGGLADGAAALLVASDEYALAHGLAPRARIVCTATCGVDPILVFNGATRAVEGVLKRARMSARDIDLYEINEAFAVVPLMAIRELELDPDRVNVNGGAIAYGHPFGATGAMLLGTVLDELERRDQTLGLVALAIGSGMGIAMIVERIG